MEFGKDVVFVLTREDVIECARELDIPEEAIKKGVDWGMEFWSEVVKNAILVAVDRQS